MFPHTFHHFCVVADWYANPWMQYLYGNTYAKKIMKVKLQHTLSKGQRYHQTNTASYIKPEVEKARVKLNKYLKEKGVSHTW